MMASGFHSRQLRVGISWAQHGRMEDGIDILHPTLIFVILLSYL